MCVERPEIMKCVCTILRSVFGCTPSITSLGYFKIIIEFIFLAECYILVLFFHFDMIHQLIIHVI